MEEMTDKAAMRPGKTKTDAKTRNRLKWMAPSHNAKATTVRTGDEAAVPGRNIVEPSSSFSLAIV